MVPEGNSLGELPIHEEGDISFTTLPKHLET